MKSFKTPIAMSAIALGAVLTFASAAPQSAHFNDNTDYKVNGNDPKTRWNNCTR